MFKTFLKFLLATLFLLIIFIGYFSLVGFETKRFNNQIKDNLRKIDKKIDVKLNDVKIVLDLINLNINAKTLGPTVSYNNKPIEVELIKSDISLLNILNKEFSLSNLFISTKSVKLKDIISFYRAVSKSNKAELFVLENFISKGFLIADINLNFNDKGEIKDDFKINGFIKDGSINLLNKNKIDKIDFIFESQNKSLNLRDLKFSYEKVNFTSKKIVLENDKKFTNIRGQIDNNEVSLSEDSLKNILSPFLKLDLKNIKFSSKNEFSLKINDKFKILDYELKSALNLNELSLSNNIDLNNIFPNLQPEIQLKNHQTKIIYTKNNLTIDGNGKFLIQKKFDSVNYKIKKNKDNQTFNIQFDLRNNPIFVDFLNYKTNENSKAVLKLNGKIDKNKLLNFKKIEFINGPDSVVIEKLVLNNNFKISNFRLVKFDFIDNQDKKNLFQVKNNKQNYLISGKIFNASKLIDDLIFKDSSKNFLDKNFNFKIDLQEVYLHDNHIVSDLKGNLEFKNNSLVSANLNSKFNENEKVRFTVISNQDQKITTFFSDQAKPFVQKFDFIKGFDKGSLDFYMVKSKNISNSKLKIYDFKLKKLPALTKILTLASLQGIADLLSGDGIGFSEFEMNFENKDKLMTINEIYAIGPAISILMEGYIEKSKLISLKGTLVPATTINKAIGSLPIIGDILVGKKTGEGVFGVSFKIKGPPDDLETTVNPIKTLTPRFITRTLEKIKKN
jgi:hypothetical protein